VLLRFLNGTLVFVKMGKRGGLGGDEASSAGVGGGFSGGIGADGGRAGGCREGEIEPPRRQGSRAEDQREGFSLGAWRPWRLGGSSLSSSVRPSAASTWLARPIAAGAAGRSGAVGAGAATASGISQGGPTGPLAVMCSAGTPR